MYIKIHMRYYVQQLNKLHNSVAIYTVSELLYAVCFNIFKLPFAKHFHCQCTN